MHLEKILDEFGLTKNKGAVYIAALQIGSGSTQDISFKVQMPRTTVHEILQHLVSLGLVSYVTSGRRRIYTAEPPKKIESLILEKQLKLESAMPELLSLYNTKGTRPKVQYYEGIHGIKTVFEDTLRVKNKVLLGILSMEDLYKIPGKDFMDDYVRRRVGAGIKLRVVRSEIKEVEEAWPASNEENRELHYAPANIIFPMTVYIYDNKVGIIGTQRENFGMIIESVDFYNTIRNLFEIMWQISKVAKKQGVST